MIGPHVTTVPWVTYRTKAIFYGVLFGICAVYYGWRGFKLKKHTHGPPRTPKTGLVPASRARRALCVVLWVCLGAGDWNPENTFAPDARELNTDIV